MKAYKLEEDGGNIVLWSIDKDSDSKVLETATLNEELLNRIDLNETDRDFLILEMANLCDELLKRLGESLGDIEDVTDEQLKSQFFIHKREMESRQFDTRHEDGLSDFEIGFIQSSIEREAEIHDVDNWETKEEYDQYTEKLKALALKYGVNTLEWGD